MNLPLSDIAGNIMGGFRCLQGINTIVEASADGSVQPDECSMAMVYVSTYLAFNVFYNLLMIVILKHGSANILWLAMTVIVPLSNVAFSLQFVPNHQPMKTMDVVGLVVIMFGLLVYRFTSQLYGLYESIVGKRISEEEKELRKKAKKINVEAEKKQTKMIGLNQFEFMNALVDSRVMRAQKLQLFRSPAQARGDLLLRLGLPPSPNIIVTSPRSPRRYDATGRTSPVYEFSPRIALSPRAQQRKAAQIAERNEIARNSNAGRPPRRPNEV